MSHVHVGQSDRMQLEEKKRKEERKKCKRPKHEGGNQFFFETKGRSNEIQFVYY